MIDRDHPGRQPQLTPHELNQEFKQVFQLLPEVGVFDEVFDRDAPMEWTDLPPQNSIVLELGQTSNSKPEIDYLKAQMRRRRQSEIRPFIQSRLKGLLGQSHLTPSAQRYVALRFDEMAIDHGREVQTEYYSQLFKWDDAKSGGIFDPNEAQSTDQNLYNWAVSGILDRQRTDDYFNNDESVQDFLREIRAAALKKFSMMTPEERAEYKARKSEPDLGQEIMQRWKDEEALVKKWRDEYQMRYGDEP